MPSGVITGGVEKFSAEAAIVGSLVTISPGEINHGLPGHNNSWMYRRLYLDPARVNRAVFRDRVASDHIHLFK